MKSHSDATRTSVVTEHTQIMYTTRLWNEEQFATLVDFWIYGLALFIYLIGQNFGGQNFRRTKFFDGQNFRYQVRFSAV